MQMIEVMKRLALLDADNPNVVDSSLGVVKSPQNITVRENAELAECGPMGMMGGPSHPPTPASISMTAGSGPELSGMLKDIMSLAGLHHDAGPMSMPMIEPAVAVIDQGHDEPEMDAGASMRSVIDKLNPDDGDDMDGDIGADDHDSGEDEVERDDEGLLGTLAGGAAGAMLGGPMGALTGASAGDQLTDPDGEETDEAQYDNSPADPTKPPPFKANKYANKENQPGQGDRMDGDKPKAYADMNEAVADLFAQYKQFVNES